MKTILSDLRPAPLFRFFEEISDIPRGSGDEERISSYMLSFAAARGLRALRDENFNVVIFSPATSGYEGAPTVLLQGHTDMVCESNTGTVHDFTKDGLKLIREGDILRADGTTLGADNGTAVAMMLSILDDPALPHPALECLFTSAEEVGLIGAQKFDYSVLSAKKVINLDSDKEGVAVASCAGMLDTRVTFDPDTVPFNPAVQKAMTLRIRGLIGGHSGEMIHSGRKSSIMIAGRLLAALYETQEFNIVSISGGNKRNAIPRECDVIIAVTDPTAATEFLLAQEVKLRTELNMDDAGFKLRIDKVKAPGKVFTYKDTGRLLSFLTLLPNGVLTMSNSMPGLTESSSNIGVIRTDDGGHIEMAITTRSSIDAITDHIKIQIERLCRLTGLSSTVDGRHPGWAFNSDSRLQKDFIKAYISLYGEKNGLPKIAAIHAGLECGVICAAIGEGSDAISIGSNVWNLHSPDERMSLSSLARTYAVLCEMLRGAK